MEFEEVSTVKTQGGAKPNRNKDLAEVLPRRSK